LLFSVIISDSCYHLLSFMSNEKNTNRHLRFENEPTSLYFVGRLLERILVSIQKS